MNRKTKFILIPILLGFVIWGGLRVKIYLDTRIPTLNITEDFISPENIETIDNWFESLHEAGKFNGSVLVARDSKALLKEAYGYTDVSQTHKLSPKSSFRLASVSKQFTAFGIMLLVERDSIRYDDLVADYIDGFPYEGVTIRHLLNMTSGIPDIYVYLAEKHKDEAGPVLSLSKAADLIVQHPSFGRSPDGVPNDYAKPNEAYFYNNTNYMLLANIIEHVSKKSFEQYMHDEVFIPLEMNNTRVWNLLSRDKSFTNKVGEFETYNGLKEVQPTWLDGVPGPGGIFSSTEDLLIWDRVLYSNDLVSDNNLREAFRRPTLANGQKSNYGFGWQIYDDGVWHTGAWLGARTFIIRNTKRKECIVILDNSSNSKSINSIISVLKSMAS